MAMNVVGKVVGSVASILDPSSAALSGSIDIIVVRRRDGTFVCTPFHVRFGKLQLFRSSEKSVQLTVNGQLVDLKMKLGQSGEAFFVQDVEEEEDVPVELATSPIFDMSPPMPISRPVTASEPIVAPVLAAEPAPRPIPGSDMFKKTDPPPPSPARSSLLSAIFRFGPTPTTAAPSPMAPSPIPPASSLVPIAPALPIVPSAPISLPMPSSLGASLAVSPSGSELGGFGMPDVLSPTGLATAVLSVPMCEISQCAHLIDMNAPITEKTLKIFTKHRITEEAFLLDPNALFAADTVYKIEDRLYPWQVAIPYIVCMAMYGRAPPPLHLVRVRPIPQRAERNLESAGSFVSSTPPSVAAAIAAAAAAAATAPAAARVSSPPSIGEDSSTGTPPTSPERNMIASDQKPTDTKLSITGATGGAADTAATGVAAGIPIGGGGDGKDSKDPKDKEKGPQRKTGWRTWFFGQGDRKAQQPTDAERGELHDQMSQDEMLSAGPGTSNTAASTAFGEGSAAGTAPASAVATAAAAAAAGAVATGAMLAAAQAAAGSRVPLKPWKKSLRPSSDQLAALALKPGANTITFSATSRIQGTQEITASIFLWREDSKIVISDIDGTITRSDVLGQVLPMWGKDWSHVGVAQLLSDIKRQGYEVMYLTARAIGQSRTTRDYIQRLRQGNATLPLGPIITTPDSLFEAFNREVIRRRPDEFKIACLTDIRRLFPPSWNPFYAGFGNRETDALSYRSVGIPLGKIFTISPAGELKCFVTTYRSYGNINELVQEIFPVVHGGRFEDENFNSWNYWRMPVGSVDFGDEPELKPQPRKGK